MPILAAEVSVFPSNLLTDFAVADKAPTDRWWAIYTKSRQEKAIARHLLGRQVPFYLPSVAKRQFIGARVYRSHLPLFPGYLFAFGSDEQRVSSILSSKRVAKVLPVFDGQLLVEDLQKIQRLIEADVPLTVEQRLNTGDFVRVKHGSFQGLEGAVVRRSGKTRLLIAVNYLQQGVSVEIDDCMVEPV